MPHETNLLAAFIWELLNVICMKLETLKKSLDVEKSNLFNHKAVIKKLLFCVMKCSECQFCDDKGITVWHLMKPI